MFKPFLLRRHFLVPPIPQAEMFPLSFSWLVLEMLVFVAAGIDLLGRDREREKGRNMLVCFSCPEVRYMNPEQDISLQRRTYVVKSTTYVSQGFHTLLRNSVAKK